MSAVIQIQTQTPAVVAKKATLSGKYSKFLVFGYGFVKSLEAKGVLSAEGVESAFEELKLMSSVEEQTSLYETLLSQTAATGKVMRKFIALRNKPPSAPRARKTPAAKPAGGEKKPRTKKSTRVENDSASDLVGQLVAAANTAAPVVVVAKKTAEEKEAEKAAAKAAKDAEKAAAKAAKDAEKAAEKAAKDAEKANAKEANAKTGKPKKAPAAKKEKTNAHVVVEEEEATQTIV